MRAPVARAAFTYYGWSSVIFIPTLTLLFGVAYIIGMTELFESNTHLFLLAAIWLMLVPLVSFSATSIILRRSLSREGWTLFVNENSVEPSLKVMFALVWGFSWRNILLNAVIGVAHKGINAEMEAAWELSTICWILAFVWLVKFPYGATRLKIQIDKEINTSTFVSLGNSVSHSLKVAIGTVIINAPLWMMLTSDKKADGSFGIFLIAVFMVVITPVIILFTNKSNRVQVFRDDQLAICSIKLFFGMFWGYIWRYTVVYGLTLPIIQNDYFLVFVQFPIEEIGLELTLIAGITFVRTFFCVLWFEMLSMGKISFRNPPTEVIPGKFS